MLKFLWIIQLYESIEKIRNIKWNLESETLKMNNYLYGDLPCVIVHWEHQLHDSRVWRISIDGKASLVVSMAGKSAVQLCPKFVQHYAKSQDFLRIGFSYPNQVSFLKMRRFNQIALKYVPLWILLMLYRKSCPWHTIEFLLEFEIFSQQQTVNFRWIFSSFY